MLSKPGGLIAVTVPAEIGLGSCTNEVTSNVMIRDGSTIVIGGLIQEQANQKPDRIPGLGSLPFVGKLFKNKSNETTRTELIVLITPGVIHDPDAECEGDLPRSENEHRHQNFRDNLSPIDRHNLARVEYERAARYFEEGDAERAKRHIDESLRHNQLDNDALRLRDQIAAALNDKNWFKKLRRKPPTELHRVPSAPALQSNGAVFEFEQEVLDSGSKPLAPGRSVIAKWIADWLGATAVTSLPSPIATRRVSRSAGRHRRRFAHPKRQVARRLSGRTSTSHPAIRYVADRCRGAVGLASFSGSVIDV